MVPCVSQIMTNNKYFPLNQNLTCANFGIYEATCLTCYQQYNGQIVNTFSTECSSRPNNWNKPDIRDNCDKTVVSRHSSVFHGIINQPHIYETSTITFIETQSFHTADTCEVKLFDKRNAHINIQSVILPLVKQLFYYLRCSMIFLFRFASLF